MNNSINQLKHDIVQSMRHIECAYNEMMVAYTNSNLYEYDEIASYIRAFKVVLDELYNIDNDVKSINSICIELHIIYDFINTCYNENVLAPRLITHLKKSLKILDKWLLDDRFKKLIYKE